VAKAGSTQTPVGALTGTNELDLDETTMLPSHGSGTGPSLGGILRQSFPFYAWHDVAAEIESLQPLRTLFVTQPGRDLSEAELRALDQFLMLGDKTLVVIASAVNLERGDDHFAATMSRRGLDHLLSAYGIEVRQDMVRDADAALELMVHGPAGVAKTRVPHVLVLEHLEGAPPEAQRLDANFGGFFRIDALAFPYASSLRVHPERQPDAKLRVVAHTSARATSSESAGDLNLGATVDPTAPQQRHAIAATAEGTLKSAFDGASAEARLLVIASSQFSTNPFARAMHHDDASQFQVMGHHHHHANPALEGAAQIYAQKHLTATILAFKNILDWASDDRALAPCSALVSAKPAASAN
jgi:hypothetical protein